MFFQLSTLFHIIQANKKFMSVKIRLLGKKKRETKGVWVKSESNNYIPAKLGCS
jgi:hypothetical protein